MLAFGPADVKMIPVAFNETFIQPPSSVHGNSYACSTGQTGP